MTWHRVTSIDELLGLCAPAVQGLVQRARERIIEVVPGATEKLRGGWGLIGYNAPAYFAYVGVEADHIRIGFEWGTLLLDPSGLLEGAGSQVRYVPVRTAKQLQSRALAALLREAAAIRPPPRRRSR